MKTRENKYKILDGLKISHRGLWNDKYPENSLGAFKRSLEQNVPIELDVHILKDGTLVVFHDDNLKRMTGVNKKIKAMTFEDIKNLRLKNSEYKIPTLEEVLTLVDGKVLLDIEIKTDVKSFKICKSLSSLLDKYKGPFLVKSFNPLYILWFRIFRPNYIRGLLVSKLVNVQMNRLIKLMCFKMYFNFLCKPDFIAFDLRDLPNAKIDKLYKKGVPIFLWTKRKNENLKCEYSGIIYED